MSDWWHRVGDRATGLGQTMTDQEKARMAAIDANVEELKKNATPTPPEPWELHGLEIKRLEDLLDLVADERSFWIQQHRETYEGYCKLITRTAHCNCPMPIDNLEGVPLVDTNTNR